MNLDQIKAHPYYPFRNFRTDDLAFLMLELYWSELFRNVVGTDNEDSQRVAEWSSRGPADREEGNPILYLIDRSTQPPRALRVIQRFNTDGLVELDLGSLAPIRYSGDAYVAFVPDLARGATDDDGTTPIEELLISSDISDACEHLAKVLIHKWCVVRVSATEMEQLLDQYWKRIRGNLVDAG